MRLGVYIILSLLVILSAAFAAYRYLARGKADGGMGFMEYVKDPTAPNRLQAEFAERDSVVAELAKESPEELVGLLKKDADQFGIPARAIEAAGPRVVPALLAAMVDPSYRGGNQKDSFGSRIVEPIEGVLSCLEEFAPTEAVPVVAPLVRDESDDVRKLVALLLGRIATDNAAEPIALLLRDEDDYVRSYAMRGILRAIEADCVADGFRQTVFDALIPLAFRRAISGSDDAPRCLLGLDKERAIPILTLPERMTADQENLHEVFGALRESSVHVEDGTLFRILSELGDANKYPADRVYGETLMMLAMANSDKARKTIQESLGHPSQRVREYAAEAQALANGLGEPLAAVWEKLDELGWENLSTPQKHVLSVRMLIDQVTNGGFLQYFVNSSSDHWPDAESGFIAIGAEHDTRLFRQALSKFGPEPPNVDRQTRHEQIATIAVNVEQLFDDIETEFYEDKYDREVLLLQYMLKNGDDFGENAKRSD